MKRGKFIKEVLIEIEAIKKNATPDEIGNLDWSSFNHESALNCIYGQMTGCCNSSRASDIFSKSLSGVVKSRAGNSDNPSFNDLSRKSGTDLTPLEQYLFIADDESRYNIIEYLKGNIKKIDIK